jgi:phage-related holin
MKSAHIQIIDDAKTMTHFFTILKAFMFTTACAFFAWAMPVRDFVAVTLIIVFADLVTGIQAAKKRGELIHSKGLRRSITKFTMYVIAILAGHAVQTVYFPDFPMVFTISSYISMTEFWSVLENVGTVTGTNVLDSVREKLTTILKK